MKNNLTFEMLPSAIQEMNNRLIRMERLLNSKSERFDSEQWFDLDKLIEYLPDHPAKQTIYGLVSNRKIPFHKRGKRLIFSKKSIDRWLDNSRQETTEEIRNKL
jgi:phosphorylcholine metabolism protein LicD